MKKIVSLLLTLCLCLSLIAALSACQKESEKNEEQQTEQTEQVEQTNKTTVTKDEFIAAVSIDNYTLTAKVYENGKDPYTISRKATDSAFVQSMTNYSLYTVKKNGVWYDLREENGAYVGTPGYYTSAKLCDLVLHIDDLGAFYDKLSYIEEDGCYYLTGIDSEDDDMEYRFYFENGSLTKIRFDESGDYQIVDVTDINRTSLDVPTFTIAQQ